MLSRLSRLLLCALLLGASSAALAARPILRFTTMPKHIIPVYEMSATNCGKLAVKLEPAGDFVSMKCEKGQTGYGGETGWTMVTSIVAEDAESTIVVYHDQAGVQTYLERQGPQRMFEDWLDFDVEGSWKSANGADGYTVSRFFGLFDSVQVPCFAFAHYGGHVARTTGYRHLVSGFYCENTESDQPVSDSRIKEMIGKIKTRVF